MSAPGVAPRLAAARVLDAVVRRGRSLKAELARVLPALDDPRDRALVEAICFAALRQRHRYEAALRGWMPRPLGARDGELPLLTFPRAPARGRYACAPASRRGFFIEELPP